MKYPKDIFNKIDCQFSHKFSGNKKILFTDNLIFDSDSSSCQIFHEFFPQAT